MIKGIFTDCIGRKFHMESLTEIVKGQIIYFHGAYYEIKGIGDYNGQSKVNIKRRRSDSGLFVPVEYFLQHAYIITECSTQKERR